MAESWPQDEVGQITSGDGAPRTGAGRVISVSPRVADPSAHAVLGLDELLRGLIEQATAVAERFQKTLEDAREAEIRAANAVAPLHERLALGGQMLEAFQAQIARVEGALAELKAQEKKAHVAEVRAQQRLADMETRMEAGLERFKKQIEELSNDALASFAARIDDARPADAIASAAEPQNVEIADHLQRLSDSMQELVRRIATPMSEPSQMDLPLKFQKWAAR